MIQLKFALDTCREGKDESFIKFTQENNARGKLSTIFAYFSFNTLLKPLTGFALQYYGSKMVCFEVFIIWFVVVIKLCQLFSWMYQLLSHLLRRQPSGYQQVVSHCKLVIVHLAYLRRQTWTELSSLSYFCVLWLCALRQMNKIRTKTLGNQALS